MIRLAHYITYSFVSDPTMTNMIDILEIVKFFTFMDNL